MGFVADVLWQIKLGEFKSAAGLLETHLLDQDLKPVSRISLMEWTADCYHKCDEYALAAKWFEIAGNSVLKCQAMDSYERRRRAAAFFERALDCNMAGNDLLGIKRTAALRYSLAPSC